MSEFGLSRYWLNGEEWHSDSCNHSISEKDTALEHLKRYVNTYESIEALNLFKEAVEKIVTGLKEEQ